MKYRETLKRSSAAVLRLWTRKRCTGEKWQDEEMDRLVSSYGSWPGHEADPVALNRLLWQMGKGKAGWRIEDGRPPSARKKGKGSAE